MNLGYWSDFSAHSYLQTASMSFLYYDHILTFPAEVSHIWPQPISANTFLFFVNRYVGFFGNIATSVLVFGNLANSPESCGHTLHAREVLLVLNQVAVSAILATRIFALYHSSRSIVIGVLGFGAVLAGVTCWALVGQKATIIRGLESCDFLVPEATGIRLAATWEAQALFDALIFVLTVMRAVKICRAHNMAINLPGMGLLDILLRDGALYFAIMGLANLANILTFYFARPSLKAVFATPASCISVTLCSRLVLNLYEAATPDTTTSNPCAEPMTTCVLTTRIELGTSTDD